MDSIKPITHLRLFFKTNSNVKKFWWFDMNKNDLYWGSSNKKSVDIKSDSFSGKTATIIVPSEYSKVDSKKVKASFHESGQFHIKESCDGQSQLTTRYSWPKPDQLIEPHLLTAIITKPPSFYENYNASLTKSHSHAILYKVDDVDELCRHYFEYFLSPEGVFNLEQPILGEMQEEDAKINIVTLSPDLSLLIRHLQFPGDHFLNTFHPDIEFSFYFDNDVNK